jgi:hypothetical protein
VCACVVVPARAYCSVLFCLLVPTAVCCPGCFFFLKWKIISIKTSVQAIRWTPPKLHNQEVGPANTQVHLHNLDPKQLLYGQLNYKSEGSEKQNNQQNQIASSL